MSRAPVTRTLGLLAAVIVLALLAPLHAQQGRLTGRLTLVWGDPIEDGPAPTFSMYVTPDGREPVELLFPEGSLPTAEQLFQLNGAVVSVAAPESLMTSATGGRAMIVPSARAIDVVRDNPRFQVVNGSQPWVTIGCRFADSAAVTPVVDTSLLVGTGFPSLDGFWRETSYDAINLAGSQVAGWIVLPQPRAYYIYDRDRDGVEDADTRRLANDCSLAADAQLPSLNFNAFVGINMIFNQSIGAFWYGGSSSLTLEGSTSGRIWRTTWIGYYPTSSSFLAALAHEYGHGFGFPHSSGPYGQTYDSRWDVMSNSYVRCCHAVQGRQYYIPQGTIGYHKDLAGWIPASRIYVPARNSRVTLNLERLAFPGPAPGYLMARIPVPGSTRFYTVEFRQQVGADVPLPGSAVLLHDVLPTRGSSALVVDPDRNGNPNDGGSMWLPGETFTDAAAGISVSVVSISGTAATVVITYGNPGLRSRTADFDGDGKTDLTIYRQGTGEWYTLASSTGTAMVAAWGGNATDVPVAGDYDGDRRSDVAVYRPANGTWYVMFSRTGGWTALEWGNSTDVPVPADYDGDGLCDVAVFRPSTGIWYLRFSSTGAAGAVAWGNGADLPAVGDYDGDGKADIAIFRPSEGRWYLRFSTTGSAGSVLWGNAADLPVPGDYDGDGATDIAVYRPATGAWYPRYSGGGSPPSYLWGNARDIPMPGDYDGDGRTDLGVFRPSTGAWLIYSPATGATTGTVWGNSSDIPIAARP